MRSLSFFTDTIDTLYHLSHIPLCLTDRSANVLHCCLKDEVSPLPEEYMKHEINLLRQNWNPAALPSMKYTESHFFLGIMAVTGEYAVLIGPTPMAPLSLETFYETNKRYLRKEQIYHLQRICDMSSLADEHRFAEMMEISARLLREQPCSASLILKDNYRDLSSVPESRPEIRLNDPEATTPEMVMAFVRRVCAAIRSGNTFTIDEVWQSEIPKNLKTGNRKLSEDQLMFIPLLSSMNNAALDCGANPTACFDIMDKFVQNLQSAVINADGYLLAKHASYDFCRLVSEAIGTPKRSPLSGDIEKYVIRNIGEKITAEDIAETFSLSKRQVFRIFQTDFHMTMTEFITKEKLRRAAVLLKTSRYSISEICNIYGFASQSYFAKRFVQIYGLTPSEYRGHGTGQMSGQF